MGLDEAGQYLQVCSQIMLVHQRRYAIAERNGIFASHYARTVGLEDLLDPETARSIDAKSTGGKVLVDPSR